MSDSDAAIPDAGADDPPGQAAVLAWIAREMRRRLRRDRLWVLAVDLPLEILLLWRVLRAVPRAGGRVVAGMVVGTIAGEALCYMLRRKGGDGAWTEMSANKSAKR